HRLAWRGEVQRQNLLVTWSAFRLRRLPRCERAPVLPGRQQTQCAVPQPVQLSRRRKHPFEARHVIVEHQIEIAIDCLDQRVNCRSIAHPCGSLCQNPASVARQREACPCKTCFFWARIGNNWRNFSDNRWIMPNSDLDTVDCRIICELQSEGRLSNVELADRIGVSPSACL